MKCRSAKSSFSPKRHGVASEKLEDIWNYRNSEHYSEAERVALDFALAAASQPNDVTDELFENLRLHWSEAAIMKILAVIGLFGFFNRWSGFRMHRAYSPI
ncbi:MAG: hypothetical protein KZQ81_04615 [Candidatus Thiodiazotropha sp. (ex Rostrolucina anterorostrata)]|nr:hypothetical protein [Candidatus Thiodiazotropha sp. (ex Rostrolucina anterorostrata)]